MVTGKQPPKKKARKGWDSLSAGYRKRLERSGISKRDYQNGVSLSRARGHEKTPERPERAYKGKNAARYGEYREKRRQKRPVGKWIKSDWVSSAIDHTRNQLSHLRYYNHNTVINNAEKKTISQLQRTVTMTTEDLQAAARPQIPGNVWWYH
jgi:hypothetical protein